MVESNSEVSHVTYLIPFELCDCKPQSSTGTKEIQFILYLILNDESSCLYASLINLCQLYKHLEKSQTLVVKAFLDSLLQE